MGKNNSLEARLRQELKALKEQDQLRTLARLEGVNLCSNDYLGLAADIRLKQAVQEALAVTSLTGSTGSRLLSGNSVQWEDAEADFARFSGREAALYFTSGYAANVGLLSTILQPQDIVFSDALNHASIIDGIRLSGARKVIYSHTDLAFLEKSLEQHRDQPGSRIIVSESVFSMDGDLAPLQDLMELARRYEAELVVDEAHATGVFGPEGRGLAAHFGMHKETLAIVHTCSKALGSMGAFVCSGHMLRNYLVNRARTFLFSTAAPPYMALQVTAALRFAREAEAQRKHLLALSNGLNKQLRAAGLNLGASRSQIIPIVLGTNEAAQRVAAFLQSHGFAVRAIRPPTVPPGTARLRISLTAGVTAAETRRLAELLLHATGQPQTSELLSHA